jgi:hypothetical protein
MSISLCYICPYKGGSKSSCIKCSDLVLAKLNEETELAQFINKGTNYLQNIQSNRGAFGGRGVRILNMYIYIYIYIYVYVFIHLYA